jgi:ArsR family transcriptional regulator
MIADSFKLTGSYSNLEFKSLSDAFKLFADPMRLRILLLLTENEEMHVNALCKELGQSQPAVSHHLALLRDGKLIEMRRDGKFNYYHVSGAEVCEQIAAFFNLTFENEPTCWPDGSALPQLNRKDTIVSATEA